MKKVKIIRRHLAGISCGFVLGVFFCQPSTGIGIALGAMVTVAALDLIDLLSEDP